MRFHFLDFGAAPTLGSYGKLFVQEGRTKRRTCVTLSGRARAATAVVSRGGGGKDLSPRECK